VWSELVEGIGQHVTEAEEWEAVRGALRVALQPGGESSETATTVVQATEKGV